jgi:hypothetical protein
MRPVKSEEELLLEAGNAVGEGKSGGTSSSVTAHRAFIPVGIEISLFIIIYFM